MILNTRTIAIFTIITALEAFGLSYAWEKVIAANFELSNIAFGQMFIVLLVGKWFTRPASIIGMAVNGILDIRDIMHFNALQNMSDVEPAEDKNPI